MEDEKRMEGNDAQEAMGERAHGVCDDMMQEGEYGDVIDNAYAEGTQDTCEDAQVDYAERIQDIVDNNTQGNCDFGVQRDCVMDEQDECALGAQAARGEDTHEAVRNVCIQASIGETRKEDVVQEPIDEELHEWQDKYGEVDIRWLANNRPFVEWAEGKVGVLPLPLLYGWFMQEQTTKRKRLRERLIEQARGCSASLADRTSSGRVHYTMQELRAMSTEELQNNWELVLESLKATNRGV